MHSKTERNKIEKLIKDVGDNCIFSYFQNLKNADVAFKESHNDPVTVADQKAEQLLKIGLLELLPNSLFVGEETYAENKNLLNFLRQSEKPVWIVDPIDGTDNFIAGRTGFGIMACLVERGKIVGSWLYEVTSKRMTAYYAPNEIWENGQTFKMKPSSGLPYKGLIGKKLHRFPEVQKLKEESADILIDPALEPSIVSYREMLLGKIDFLVFKVTYPWDHLPGIAFLQSCGAQVRRWNGEPFEFSDTHEGLIISRNEEIMNIVQDIVIKPLMRSDEILKMTSFR